MSEDSESPKPNSITRRKLLTGLGAAAGAAGLAYFGLRRSEPQAAPEQPLTVKAEVKKAPNEEQLLKQLHDKYGIDSLTTKTATFNISASSEKGQTNSSFAVAERPKEDIHGYNRVFIEDRGNMTELLPWFRAGGKTENTVIWYIPGRDAVPGKDVGANDRPIPGAIGMQPILTARDNTAYLQELSYRPPAAQNTSLFGQNFKEDMIRGGVIKRDELSPDVSEIFDRRETPVINLPPIDATKKNP